MKIELDNQYQTWQDKIESRNVGEIDISSARIERFYFGKKMKTQRDNIENVILISGKEKLKQELKLLIEELDQFVVQLVEQCSYYVNCVNEIIEQQALTPERIHQFDKFTADESFVGEQCVICMGAIEIGRNMMRLDCDGQHTFCQV